MKKISFYVIFFVLSSCTIYRNGTLQNSTVLNQRNFVYKGLAEGEAKEIYLLAFLGLGNRRNLVRDAYADMQNNFPLKEGQVYANVGVDTRWSSYILWTTRKVVVSGDLIELQAVKRNANKWILSSD